jgi:hypothetical protein
MCIIFFVHGISTLLFVQYVCLQSFDSTLDSSIKDFVEWVHAWNFSEFNILLLKIEF